MVRVHCLLTSQSVLDMTGAEKLAQLTRLAIITNSDIRDDVFSSLETDSTSFKQDTVQKVKIRATGTEFVPIA